MDSSKVVAIHGLQSTESEASADESLDRRHGNSNTVGDHAQCDAHLDEEEGLRLADSRRDAWRRDLELLRPPSGQLTCILEEAAKLAANYIPQELREQLADVTRSSGLVVQKIDNLPVDLQLPDVPQDGQRPLAKRMWVTELALVGTCMAVNLEPLSYRQEKKGEWPQNVAPVPGKENSNSNASREEFGPHSDNAILDKWHRVYIALLGLRNDDNTATHFAAVDDIVDALPAQHVAVLREPLFRSSCARVVRNGANLFGATVHLALRSARGG